MKYLIKVTYKARENNPNFAGQIQIWYCGKSEHSVDGKNGLPDSYFIDNYAYSRKSDALKNYHFKFSDDEIYWDKDVEIIEIV